MENSNLPALNNNVSGTYGPQFFNPTEGLEVAYNVIEYYDKKSGADRTVLCRDVMINSDFIIAGSTLYRNRITAASPEVGIPLLKKFEYTIKDKREVHAGNYHTEWTCSTANEEKRNIIADYHTEKARVTILKENLLDMTSETIMPDVEDINRESEMWIVRTHSEAVALSKKGAQAWNKECKKAFKDQMSDPEFLRKYVLIMKRASLLTLRGDYRNKLDAAYSKKLFGLLAAKKTNTVEKTRKFFYNKVEAKFPWDVEGTKINDEQILDNVRWFREKAETCLGTLDNDYLDPFYKAIGITSAEADTLIEEHGTY